MQLVGSQVRARIGLAAPRQLHGANRSSGGRLPCTIRPVRTSIVLPQPAPFELRVRCSCFFRHCSTLAARSEPSRMAMARSSTWQWLRMQGPVASEGTQRPCTRTFAQMPCQAMPFFRCMYQASAASRVPQTEVTAKRPRRRAEPGSWGKDAFDPRGLQVHPLRALTAGGASRSVPRSPLPSRLAGPRRMARRGAGSWRPPGHRWPPNVPSVPSKAVPVCGPLRLLLRRCGLGRTARRAHSVWQARSR